MEAPERGREFGEIMSDFASFYSILCLNLHNKLELFTGLLTLWTDLS